MGIRAHLREIPANKFEAVTMGEIIERQVVEDAPSVFLDKSWHEIHLLFRDMESPLRYIISGDWHYPECSPTIEGFAEGKTADYYFAFASPSLVLQINTALKRLSESELAGIADQIDIVFDDYIRDCVEVLKQTYSHAARNGNAVSITIV